MIKKYRFGLRDTTTGEVNKVLFGTEAQANMQKPRDGFAWIELPDSFDLETQVIDVNGLIEEKD